MRRFELLVNEVRQSTDTTDINSLGFYEVMRYFNDGQKQIQKIIFTANPSADIFVKPVTYNIAGSGTKEQDLPWDIYAHSSIISINTLGSGQKITRLSNSERPAIFGYAIVDKQFVLSFNPQEDLVVNYVYKLPLMSYRLGRITNVDTGTGVVTVDVTTAQDNTDFTNRYDKYSIVDSNGENTANRLELTSVSGAEFTFVGDLDTAAIGNYIVCGENGTSHSKLPDECEPMLMSYVQRRILAKLSSGDGQAEALFTNEERTDLEDLFQDNVKDALYPVSSDTDYLGI